MRNTARRFLSVLAVVGLLIAGCTSATPPAASSSPAASGAAATTKPLSQADVAIHASFGVPVLPAYIADKEGFFKKNGVNVKLTTSLLPNVTAGSTTLLAGTYQFVWYPTTTTAQAVSAGGPFKGVMTGGIGSNQAIFLTAAKMQALGIPLTATTPDAIAAQFKALKGSRVKIAVTGVTANIYAALLLTCANYQLTCAADSPTSDINFQFAGTSPLVNAGVNTGQYDGAAQVPAQNQITVPFGVINFSLLAPNPDILNTMWVTTSTFAKEHPDTVQAVVTSLMEGWEFIRKNPAAARKYNDEMLTANGVTAPAALEAQFKDGLPLLRTPLLTQKGYKLALDVLNVATKPPVNVAFGDLIDDSYVKNAITQLKLTNVPE